MWILYPQLFRMEQEYFLPHDITQSRNCGFEAFAYSLRLTQIPLLLMNGPLMYIVEASTSDEMNFHQNSSPPNVVFDPSSYRRATRLKLPQYRSRRHQAKDFTAKRPISPPGAACASLAVLKLCFDLKEKTAAEPLL